jgi:hypothetical protein
MLSTGPSILNTEDFNMKTILKSISNFIMACTEACYAAHLARNGQHTRAKDIYK